MVGEDNTLKMVASLDDGTLCHECYFYSFVERIPGESRCPGCRVEDRPLAGFMSYEMWQNVNAREEFAALSFENFIERIEANRRR